MLFGRHGSTMREISTLRGSLNRPVYCAMRRASAVAVSSTGIGCFFTTATLALMLSRSRDEDTEEAISQSGLARYPQPRPS